MNLKYSLIIVVILLCSCATTEKASLPVENGTLEITVNKEGEFKIDDVLYEQKTLGRIVNQSKSKISMVNISADIYSKNREVPAEELMEYLSAFVKACLFSESINVPTSVYNNIEKTNTTNCGI